MPKTKCEYPSSLGLWADVIKSKYIAREVPFFASTFWVPFSEVGGLIEEIEYIQARVLTKEEVFSLNKVCLRIGFEIIMLVLVNSEPQVITISSECNQDCPLCDFSPPLNASQFREEVSSSQAVVTNWRCDCAILGRSDEPSSSFDQTLTTPIAGTLLRLNVTADIINRLTMAHDVVLYAEFDPDD